MNVHQTEKKSVKINGGKREGAGRPKGQPNKVAGEVRALARAYGPAAVEKAAKLAGLVLDEDGVTPIGMSQSDQTQLAALSLLLDRGYGKAPQALTGEDGEGPVKVEHVVKNILGELDGSSRGIPSIPSIISVIGQGEA